MSDGPLASERRDHVARDEVAARELVEDALRLLLRLEAVKVAMVRWRVPAAVA